MVNKDKKLNKQKWVLYNLIIAELDKTYNLGKMFPACCTSS